MVRVLSHPDAENMNITPRYWSSTFNITEAGTPISLYGWQGPAVTIVAKLPRRQWCTNEGRMTCFIQHGGGTISGIVISY
jgi:hypothetical protein